MPFKPNYNQQRAERTRAKEQKKQEKLQRRQEESERRKAGLPPAGADAAADAPANASGHEGEGA